MSQEAVLKEFGYPVVSKRAAKSISHLQNPTEKNANSRRLALTGITNEGRYAKTWILAQKWRFLIDAPFKISNKCCYYMKETPVENWRKENGKASIVATLVEPLVIETPEAATEGSIRVYDYDGCCIYSYYGKIRINSDGKDGKEIDVEALGYLEGYQEHKEESRAGE